MVAFLLFAFCILAVSLTFFILGMGRPNMGVTLSMNPQGWVVENVGVSPDIEVLDRPELVARGADPSLERAVEILMEELEKKPPVRVQASPAPVDRHQ